MSHYPPLESQRIHFKQQPRPEIQRDAKDPQLLANLSRLNPVQVHHHRPPVETVSCTRTRYRFVSVYAKHASEARPRQGIFRIALEGGG